MCDLCPPNSNDSTAPHGVGPFAASTHEGARHPARRGFLRASLLAAAASWTLGTARAATAEAAANATTPAAALKRLLEGNARYVANAPQEKDFSVGRGARVSAQYPIAAILSCADSRLAPEFAFDQGPGDLFVTRVAGNYVSPAVLSSLEYAVAVLDAPLVIVLGHSNCGAVSATVKGLETKDILPGTMQDIVKAILPAVIRAQGGTGGSMLERSIVENVKLQVQVLETRPSLVQSMLKDKKIEVVGAVYDLATGKIMLV
ncbi:MAG: carbonic anhydrase [Gammaproteobacteria bacterium]|nr:carbonic anhydrase [Gammaproteobacteria bacterium]